MKIFRSIFRKKFRSLLTIFGIAIGVLAFVVMGSLAEKMNLLIEGGVKFYGTRITIQDAKSQMSFFGSNPINIAKIEEINKIKGVKSAYPSVDVLKDEMGGMSLGSPATISGVSLGSKADETFIIKIVSGRDLQEGDSKKVVLGSDLAKKDNSKVGDKIKLRDKEFEIVGIMEKTFTAPDNSASVPIVDAQEFLAEDIPSAYRSSVDTTKLATSLYAFTEDGANPDEVAKLINDQVKDVKALAPNEFKKQFESSMAIFNAIVMGSALVALMVGGFSIINVMVMAVSERTKEIGIKKAIGASNKRIIYEIVAEASLMGLMGGLLGLFSGWLIVVSINAVSIKSGDAIFLTTPRLAIGAIIFAVSLGAVAGLYPARRASKLDPIEALRYE